MSSEPDRRPPPVPGPIGYGSLGSNGLVVSELDRGARGIGATDWAVGDDGSSRAPRRTIELDARLTDSARGDAGRQSDAGNRGAPIQRTAHPESKIPPRPRAARARRRRTRLMALPLPAHLAAPPRSRPCDERRSA
jgi:hypothetical protein